MHYNLKQIRFQKQDHSSFLVPKLEKQIRLEEHQLKSKNNAIIKIGCFISLFSLQFGYRYSLFQQSTNNLLLIISQYLFQIFSCLLCGFFVDIISIKSSWYFFITANVLAQLIQLSSVLLNNSQILYIALLLSQFLIPICVINCSCILYEAATSFKDRLNNAVKLEAYGDYLAYIIPIILQILQNEIFKINEERVKQIQKYILISVIIFCQLLNLISLAILNKTYKQIENIKKKSFQYQRFLIYSGVGLSISKIFKYFKNKNICFLLVISALCGCQNESTFYFVDQISSIQNLIINLIGASFGMLIMKIINSNQNLVQTCYKYSSYCQYSYLSLAVIFLIIRILQQETNLFSKELYQVFATILLSIKESTFFIIYCLIHQMVIILLPNRSSARAIGLSITFLPFFSFNMFCILSINSIIQMRVAQIIIIITTIIIDYLYQKNICFNKIEQQLRKQYNILNH